MELSLINRKLAMDSRDIAKQMHKQHRHILRDIENMLQKISPDLGASFKSSYKDKYGRIQPCYKLPYRELLILLTGYSVELRTTVIDRWAFLERNFRAERQKSIEVRNTFTDELKSHAKTIEQLTFEPASKAEKTVTKQLTCEPASRQWYTIEELASLCGLEIGSVKNVLTELRKFGSNFEMTTKTVNVGGHRNVKEYSGEILRAIKEYQLKNSVPNATKDKGTVIGGNISFVQQETVKQTIDSLLDNPKTLQLLLSESLSRQKSLQIENKQLKDLVEEQKSKALVYDRISNGKGCFSMNQAAKALGLPYGNRTLFRKLREDGCLNADNSPTQRQIKEEHFKVVVKYVSEQVGNKPVTLVTGKGLVYLVKKFNTQIDETVQADA